MGNSNWGTAVLCFLIGFLVFGSSRLSSLLYVSSIYRYNVSREQAALPFTLCYTIRNLIGPLIGILGSRFGCRAVTIFGCLLSSIGVGICFLAESIILVTISWGVIYGLGFGLGTTLLVQIIKENFDKHIDKVYGLYFASECVAAFLLPLLVEYLLNIYGTSGTFLILSSVILHSVPAAMLLKSRTPSKIIQRELKTVSNTFIQCVQEDFPNSKKRANMTFETDRNISRDVPQDIKENFGIPLKVNKAEDEITKIGKVLSNSNARSKFQNENGVNERKELNELKSPNSNVDINMPTTHTNFNNLYNNEQNKNVKISKWKFLCRSLRVFKNLTFLLILVTQSSLVYIASTTWAIMIDFARDAHTEVWQEKYLLMCAAISDTIGRFSFGFITDGEYMRKTTFAALCYFSLAVVYILATFLSGFVAMMVVIAVFGTTIGAIIMISAGIISQNIEADELTMAFSSRYFLFPLMGLSQSPLIGFFRETKQSYNGLLYVLASICFVSSVLTLLIPTTVRIKKAKKQKLCGEENKKTSKL